MKKVFAFLLMTDQGPEETRTLPGSGWTPCLCQCAPSRRAADTVRRLVAEQGLGAVELCGAFGPEGAAAVKEAAGPAVAVGYVTHSPSEDGLFQTFFAE